MDPKTAASLKYQMENINDDRSHELIALNVVFPLIALIAVILRVVARRITHVKLLWDDYIIFLSMVCLLSGGISYQVDPPLTL